MLKIPTVGDTVRATYQCLMSPSKVFIHKNDSHNDQKLDTVNLTVVTVGSPPIILFFEKI
jgi:hypothetical protein